MDDGKLSPDEKQKVVEWIGQKTALIGRCEVCGERRFGVADHVVDAPIYHGGELVLGGPRYTFAMIICANCGNTRFLNAVMIGLLSGAPTSDVPPDEHKGDAA